MGKMLVNARSANRYSFRCSCCKWPKRYKRLERRIIKRRERQQWKRSL